MGEDGRTMGDGEEHQFTSDKGQHKYVC